MDNRPQRTRHGATLVSGRFIAPLSDFFAAQDFWRLQPFRQAVTGQTTAAFPRSQIAAAGTEARDLVVAYVPEDRSVNLATSALPARSVASWFNPRTGEQIKAKAVAGAATANFATPGPGDWLLMLKSGR
jgi:hypothetical protein